MDWMEEIPDDLAKERFGDRLYISSFAVVDKGSKVRVAHDASSGVHLNHRIKVLYQVRYPAAGKLRAILEERLAAGRKGFV